MLLTMSAGINKDSLSKSRHLEYQGRWNKLRQLEKTRQLEQAQEAGINKGRWNKSRHLAETKAEGTSTGSCNKKVSWN